MQLNVVPNFNVLKTEVVEARCAKCTGCIHAMANPFDPWGKPLWWCGKLFDPTKRHMRSEQWPAYLVRLWEDAMAACPIGEWEAARPEDRRKEGDAAREFKERTWLEIFHELWAEIHDPERHWTSEWWRSVLIRLPCGDCKTETKAYEAKNPIPFDDDRACFLWGLEFHNVVNVRLGKPEVKHPGTKPGRS